MTNPVYSLSVSFSASRLDRTALEEILSEQFGATDVRIVAEYRGTVGRENRAREHPSRGLAEFRAIAAERKVFRWREVCDLPAAQKNLQMLLGSGELQKVGHGVYALTGTEDVVQHVQRLGPYQSKRGARQQAILDALCEPRTAGELRALSGVSRQAVDQTLKKLLKAGLICRHQTAGEQCEWLYVREGKSAAAAVVERTPVLSEMQKRILNLLPPAGVVPLRDIRRELPSYAPPLGRLIQKRLVERAGGPKSKIVRLTRAGIDHPDYDLDAAHLKDRDEAALLLPAFLKLLLAIDALGEARALDLTAVAKLKRKGGTTTGQHLQQLQRRGYIQQIRREKGKAPFYRLTKDGVVMVAIAKQRGQGIDRQKALDEVERSNADRAARYREIFAQRAGRAEGQLSSREADILTTVDKGGQLTTGAVQGGMEHPFQNPKSIHQALEQLRKRGLLVQRKSGRTNLWSVSTTGRGALGTGTGGAR